MCKKDIKYFSSDEPDIPFFHNSAFLCVTISASSYPQIVLKASTDKAEVVYNL